MLIIERKNYSGYEQSCLRVLTECEKDNQDKFVIGSGEHYGKIQIFKGNSGNWHTVVLTKDKPHGYHARLETFSNVDSACNRVREFVKAK